MSKNTNELKTRLGCNKQVQMAKQPGGNKWPARWPPHGRCPQRPRAGRWRASVPCGRVCPKTQTNWCLRWKLLVMCTYPFAKKALTLHLACGEGRARHFGCNLMQRKVLASSHQHLMAEAPVSRRTDEVIRRHCKRGKVRSRRLLSNFVSAFVNAVVSRLFSSDGDTRTF